jgi:SRSO17 transposase
VGVAHQYCGQLGKNANCQALVSLTMARDEMPVPVALRLYLPKPWTEDQGRRRKCGVPEEIAFRPKWKIALDEIERVVEAGVTFGDVLADAGYGVCIEFRRGLTDLGLRWAVGISPDQLVYAMSTRLRSIESQATTGRPPTRRVATAKPRRARDVIASLGPHALWTVAWRRGTKGALSAEFTALRIRVADGEPVIDHRHGPGDEAWLICERRSGGETKYHLSNYPADTPLDRLVASLKSRWACEQAHQQMKEELGLDHFEGRSWTGLHHHTLLTMIAFAFLQYLRKRENKAAA